MRQDNRKVMIRLEHVGKVYRLGQIGSGTLRRDLQSWWYRKRGLEDPNTKIGQRGTIYGDRFEALKDINLTVFQGERLGIIGGNGAGKSTMLKLISRVTAPTSGDIDLYGRVTSMLEVGTGFHGEMTGRENIYMNGAILGMTKKEIDAVLEDIIEFSEVREFIDTPVKRYSSGMYVKLAFSVAAHLNSEIVIMDEVLAVGDIAFQKKCIDKMMRASLDENKTVLYVSHNMKTIRDLCDRCIVLDQGEIIYDGDVEEAIRYYSDHLMRARGLFDEQSLDLRRDKNTSGICRVEGVLLDNELVRMGEALKFRLRVSSKESLPGVRVRLVVSNAEGVIIGMTFSDAFDLPDGETVLDCRFPADPLAAGGYACDIALFDYENGEQTRHDFVRKALSFQIEETTRFWGKNWTIGAWGSVRLSPMTAEPIRPAEAPEEHKDLP
ncbi:MAG: ABC transporter ATP-binding protein [Oscillospiraceae bacterium]|nr:ABC transporter ATP-binding protein [Oscillospiraceae bacterium]